MRTSGLAFSSLVLLLVASERSAAYYIPGLAPVGYAPGDAVEVLANGIHSHSAVVPFGYYKLPFCKPIESIQKNENLGQVLWGDHMESSPYTFNMAVDVACQKVQCQTDEGNMNAEKLKLFETFIENGYRGYLVLDNLPVFNNGSFILAGRCKAVERKNWMPFDYLRGYAIGVSKECTGGPTLINNHLHFRIQYHKAAEDEYRVVGFTAIPYSIDHTDKTCSDKFFDMQATVTHPLTTDPGQTKRITWTYGVTWVEEPNIQWGGRWDTFLHSSLADSNDRIHWFSIFNSIIVVVCLLSVVFVALIRALRKDFARYNAVLASIEAAETGFKEETGWKLVYKDVFRPPENVNVLIVCVSSGVQILGMALETLVVACFGALSPANRGALLMVLILFFVLQAFVAGYVCARLLKQFSQKSWVPIFETALFLPGFIIAVFVGANILLRSVKASSAVSFYAMATIIALWLLVSVPLAVLGGSFGFSAEPWSNPNSIVTSLEPRPIPDQAPFYLQDIFVFLVPGLVPLGTTFLELRFILASLWQGMVYYVFGFLAIVVFLWLISAALTTVVFVYYRLCAENYRWWWVSFVAPGAWGLHLFLYFIYYYSTQLNIRTQMATILYFLYMAIVAVSYALMVGVIGFVSSYLFVRKMYSAIKLE